MTVSRAVSSDAAAIRELWQIAFGDTPQDIDGFLRRYDLVTYALVLKAEHTLCSMLFLLPVMWRDGEDSRTVGYIYAGATHPQCRGKGYYKRLLRYAWDCAAQCGMSALMLRPATAALEESYRRMGFTVPLTCRETQTTVALLDGAAVDAATYRRYRTAFLQQHRVPFADWDETFLEQALTWCDAVQTADGMILYTKEKDHLIVWEWLSDKPFAADGGVSATVRTVGDSTVVGLLSPIDGAVFTHGYMGYGLE